jgi:RND family efflux transporter MFP subunit
MVRIYNEARAETYKSAAIMSYAFARSAYQANFDDYRATGRYSDGAVIDALVSQTYETVKKISETIKNTDNLVSYVKDTLTQQKLSVPPAVTAHQAVLKADIAKINSIINNLLSAKTAILNSRDAIVSATRLVAEKELSLEKLKAGADALSLRSKQLNVRQKEDALAAAREHLADYWIRAPFDGVVSKIDLKRGDSVSTGVTAAVFVTKQKMAEISLNEVDVAKVKAGQKVNLTFDAVQDLNITGEVAEVDALGAVSQGVVTYDVKIIFDTQDERIKPGMSVSAVIITNVKQDVLIVPGSAIKTSGGASYIEIPAENVSAESSLSGVELKKAPQRQLVETGLSNDTSAEIISGLKEGDTIITRTTVSSAKQTTQGQSILQQGTRTGGASSATRVPTGGMMMIR